MQQDQLLLIASLVSSASAWSASSGRRSVVSLEAVSRRSVLNSALVGGLVGTANAQGANAAADDDDTGIAKEEDFTSIAERAAKLSKTVAQEEDSNAAPAPKPIFDGRSAYDFSLPVAGETVKFQDMILQNQERSKVKAILVVNIKQDDPVARKNIPEFIALASKYGRDGEFVVVLSPTDQGYYEPDTSALIRLKLAAEYGWGINPATVLTDKVILLGTGAHPFWRWLEGTARTPIGLGRIQGNFEKFLLDGQTGLPLRRYPRKYMPNDIKDDIESILQDRSLPPAGANFNEEWRVAANDSLRDVYRFQKGLNVFDQ